MPLLIMNGGMFPNDPSRLSRLVVAGSSHRKNKVEGNFILDEALSTGNVSLVVVVRLTLNKHIFARRK